MNPKEKGGKVKLNHKLEYYDLISLFNELNLLSLIKSYELILFFTSLVGNCKIFDFWIPCNEISRIFSTYYRKRYVIFEWSLISKSINES